MSDPTEQDAPTGPYATAAQVYWQSGWRGLLPVPYGRKTPVPTGYTGTNGAWPSYPDVHAWTEQRGADNIALRLPPDVLGIDVDQYDAKPGGLVLADLEQRLGQLPATWRTTSRDDGISGIRLYRIPAGLRWPGVLGPGIETIRHEHRYALAWPSAHPKGGTYRWITPSGAVAINTVPAIDELPTLPATWVEHFTKGEQATDQPRAELSSAASSEWLTERGSNPMCNRTREALASGLLTLTGATSRHDATLQLTNRIIWLTGEGHQGGSEALLQAHQAFLRATAGDRTDGEASAEWARMVSGAVAIGAVAHPDRSPDPCNDPFHGLIQKENSWPTTTTTTTATTSMTRALTHPQPKSAPSVERTDPSASTSTEPSTSAATTDDAVESQIQRNQLANVELERLRAQRTARRILDEEDEESTVADRVRSLSITERAQREWKRTAAGSQEPPEPISLTDLLATPDDPVLYRFDDVWPAGGRIVLAAAAKSGKSTMVGNVLRSLADGDLFLDYYPVVPPTGRIVLIDNELDPRQIKHWLRTQGILDTDRIEVVPLRGKVATFDITDPATREYWAGKLREKNASVVIFDCLRPLIDALGLDENRDAGRILVAFDALLADSGASEGMVVHHMGHNGERSRGDTRIRDWPDAEWKIVREKNDEGESEDGSPRYFSAFGRDVHVAEGQLTFDPLTKRLSIAGGSRKDARLAPALEAVYELLTSRPNGMSGNAIETALQDTDLGRNAVRTAYKKAATEGQLRVVEGTHRSKLYILSDISSPVFATSSPPQTANSFEPLRRTPFRGAAVANWNGEIDPSPRHGELANSPLAWRRAVVEGNLVEVNLQTGEVQELGTAT